MHKTIHSAVVQISIGVIMHAIDIRGGQVVHSRNFIFWVVNPELLNPDQHTDKLSQLTRSFFPTTDIPFKLMQAKTAAP